MQTLLHLNNTSLCVCFEGCERVVKHGDFFLTHWNVLLAEYSVGVKFRKNSSLRVWTPGRKYVFPKWKYRKIEVSVRKNL